VFSRERLIEYPSKSCAVVVAIALMIHCSQFCINVTLIPERKSFALNEIKAEHILLEKINVHVFTLF